MNGEELRATTSRLIASSMSALSYGSRQFPKIKKRSLREKYQRSTTSATEGVIVIGKSYSTLLTKALASTYCEISMRASKSNSLSKMEKPRIYTRLKERHIIISNARRSITAKKRASWHSEDSNLPCIDGLPPTLKQKIKSVYQDAKTQLDAAPKHPEMKYLVTMVINIDHQISGFPDSEAKMCLDYLNSIEDPKYFIDFHVHYPLTNRMSNVASAPSLMLHVVQMK